MNEQTLSNNPVLLVIPARRGSSFNRKNIYPCAGRPLIQHTIDASRIDSPHDTIISTNDNEVKAEAEMFGIPVHQRKEHQASAAATLDTVMHEIANVYPNYLHYIMLPPTSPLRRKGHVQEAYNLFLKHRADSLISVTEERRSIWKIKGDFQNTPGEKHDGIPYQRVFARPIVERNLNRQSVEPVYVANGAIFISSREAILTSKHKVSGKVALYVMEEKFSVDVHNKEDIELAEYYMGKQQ